MKKTFINLLLTILLSFIISGCAAKTNIRTEVVNVDEYKQVRLNYFVHSKDPIENIENIGILQNVNQRIFVKKVHRLKIILKAMAEETLKNGYTHFVIAEKTFGQEDGSLPINTFNGIKEFALNNELSNKKIGSEAKSKVFTEEDILWWKFKMLKNPDYKILAMDAKSVLKEIEEYKIDMKEVALIKD